MLRQILIYLILILILSACMVQADSGLPLTTDIVKNQEPSTKSNCGDGICDGPETAETGSRQP